MSHQVKNPKSDSQAWQGLLAQEAQLDYYNRACASILKPHLGQRILDIGIGTGNVAIHLAKGALSYVGVDLEEKHIRYSAHRLSGIRFQGHVVDMGKEGALSFLNPDDFDSIVSINCLEHIEDDIGTLRRLWDIALPGTPIVILVPAHGFLYGALDRQAGHFRRYDKQQLRKTMESAGFAVTKLRHYNIMGALAWLLAGRQFIRKPDSEVAQPDKVTPRWSLLFSLASLARFPMQTILALERSIPFPIGLSLIALGKKPFA